MTNHTELLLSHTSYYLAEARTKKDIKAATMTSSYRPDLCTFNGTSFLCRPPRPFRHHLACSKLGLTLWWDGHIDAAVAKRILRRPYAKCRNEQCIHVVRFR